VCDGPLKVILVSTKLFEMALAAEVLKAIASPRRRAILRLVWDRERSAGEIHEELRDVTFGAISQHLGSLEEVGLLARRAEGKQRFYRVRHEGIGESLRVSLEEMWDDALYELKMRAELEEARRGPLPQSSRKKKKGRKRHE
jgi:DNA-binding transcriptional ArsR family regulator